MDADYVTLFVAAMATVVTVVGLVWTIVWAYNRAWKGDLETLKKELNAEIEAVEIRLKEARADCEKRSTTHITSLKRSVYQHLEDLTMHRDKSREEAQFGRVETMIKGNKETMITHQRQVALELSNIKTQLTDFTKALLELSTEVRKANGNPR